MRITDSLRPSWRSSSLTVAGLPTSDDGVDALALLVDLVGEATTAPDVDGLDGAAVLADEVEVLVERRLDRPLLEVGVEDDHELVVTHERIHLLWTLRSRSLRDRRYIGVHRPIVSGRGSLLTWCDPASCRVSAGQIISGTAYDGNRHPQAGHLSDLLEHRLAMPKADSPMPTGICLGTRAIRHRYRGKHHRRASYSVRDGVEDVELGARRAGSGAGERRRPRPPRSGRLTTADPRDPTGRRGPRRRSPAAARSPKTDAHHEPEHRAEQGDRHRLQPDHPSQLRPAEPDGAQQPDLAGPLDHRQRQGVDDAEHRDDDRQRRAARR